MASQVLLIDDDARLTAMVGDYLRAAGYQVTTAGSLAAGREALQRASFDVLVLDLMLPDGDGLDLTRELRAQPATRGLPLLMLTARGEPMDRVIGLELGADDYLGKPFEPRELLARVKALLRRSAPAGTDDVLRFGRLEIDAGQRSVRLDGQERELTSYQFDLLTVLARSPGRVLSRDQIMDALKGHPLEAFDRSIDVHISRIRAAIEDDPKVPRRILTVVTVLVLFALIAGWIAQHNMEQERAAFQSRSAERAAVLGELIENDLPPPEASAEQQRAALVDWAARLGVPMAIDSALGERIATSDVFARRERERARWHGSGDPPRAAARVPLSDGRVLWVDRPGPLRMRGGGLGGERGAARLLAVPQGLVALAGGGMDMALAFAVLFLAVAAGAFPVVRHLTRRLEALRSGVEVFGAGELSHRVHEGGRDEVAAVAASFNRAAQRVEDLVRANKSLLANASHELRSPLARMKMAVAMLDDAAPVQREQLKREIETNIAELDTLVEEVLLASRLDAVPQIDRSADVDLLALSAEEGARVNAAVEGEAVNVSGDERLLRRALRNLLENARRYGGDDVICTVKRTAVAGAGTRVAEVRVADRGPGVPDAMRERIFEPFFRLPGHAERAGGVGLGLSLVRQIAQRHGGSVRCEARDGPGSCFVLSLPVAA